MVAANIKCINLSLLLFRTERQSVKYVKPWAPARGGARVGGRPSLEKNCSLYGGPFYYFFILMGGFFTTFLSLLLFFLWGVGGAFSLSGGLFATFFSMWWLFWSLWGAFFILLSLPTKISAGAHAPNSSVSYIS